MSERWIVTLSAPVAAREALEGGRIGGPVLLPAGTRLHDERDSWRRYARTFPKGVLVMVSVLWPRSDEWQPVRIPAAEALAAMEEHHE